jgi:hypothetical protein
MFRKWLAIGLALAAVTAVATAQVGSTIVVDDFDDGDAVGWDQNDFTGVGTFDASSGAYKIESAVPIDVDDLSAGAIESHWERSLEVPRYANGTVRGTIRANTDGTTAGFLLRDSELTESDYGFYGSTSFGTFYIERFEFDAHPEAPQTIIAMADPDEVPFVAGVTYNLEASVVGHTVMLKAWPVGDDEPVEPTLIVTDKVLIPGVGNRLSVLVFFDPAPLIENGVEEVQVSGTFDDITFTPGSGP